MSARSTFAPGEIRQALEAALCPETTRRLAEERWRRMNGGPRAAERTTADCLALIDAENREASPMSGESTTDQER